MSESNSNVPISIEQLMEVYEKYERKPKKKKFWTDPITSFHENYFYTKYKLKPQTNTLNHTDHLGIKIFCAIWAYKNYINRS